LVADAISGQCADNARGLPGETSAQFARKSGAVTRRDWPVTP
jgi:hypothetical protein